MNKPDLALLYEETIENEFFDQLRRELHSDSLNLVIESRPKSGAFACVEWYIPATVMAFVGKSYFDGFLKEMGKDHYEKLKNKLSITGNAVVSNPRIEPVLTASSPEKLSNANPFSLSFSIVAEANDKYRFKLLLPKFDIDLDYPKLISAFMDFVRDFHDGKVGLEDIGFSCDDRSISKVVFVTVDGNFKVKWLDESLYR